MIERLSVVVPAFNEQDYIGGTLDSLYATQKPSAETSFVIVDNGSTDKTQEVIALFLKEHPDFPLTVLVEAEKGTGSASDTGFSFAIGKQQADIIARTDSDTVVSSGWLRAIEDIFIRRENAKLVTGPVHPLRDRWYKPIDLVAFPLSRAISRGLKEVGLLTIPSKSILTPGHNMATQASAYEAVGGFPRTSIDDTNEDIEYRNRIIEKYGVGSLEFTRTMSVAISMRRNRQVGYLGLFSYYINRGDAERRLRASKGTIDVR
jgi:glycosyltransferase involved in cell wall biosynthesis